MVDLIGLNDKRTWDNSSYDIWTPETAIRKIDLVTRARAAFTREWGYNDNVLFLQVPGRTETGWINHGDYCGLETIVAAIENGLIGAISPRNDRKARIHSEGYGTIEYDLDNPDSLNPERFKAKGMGWGKYAATVLRRLKKNFDISKGYDMAITSDLPADAGLSTSSAMIILNTLSAIVANNLEQNAKFKSKIPTVEDLVLYTGCIENGNTYKEGTAQELEGETGVGSDGGSQDHAVIMLAEGGFFTNFLTAPEFRLIEKILFPQEWVIVLGYSGVKANKSEGEGREAYNSCSGRAAEFLAGYNHHHSAEFVTIGDLIRRLREVGKEKILEYAKAPFEEVPANDKRKLVDRFRHSLYGTLGTDDGLSVETFKQALRNKDIDAVGRHLRAAHILSKRYLWNTVPEMSAVSMALQFAGGQPTVVDGAGFAGYVFSVAHVDDVKSVVQGAEHYLKTNHGIDPRFIITRPCYGLSTLFIRSMPQISRYLPNR